MFELEFILKFLKFGIVGTSGVGIDFGITYLFKEKAQIHRYIANSIGFICAASSNYIFNRIWTFNSNDPEIMKQYFIFVFISIIGLAINNLFLYLFETKAHLKFYLAKLVAIGITTLWNFAANYLITFA